MKYISTILVILFSLNTFSQKQCICDSLFNIQKLTEENKWPISTIESLPIPYNRKEKTGNFVIRISKKDYPTLKYCSSYLKHIVDIDSTVKCIRVVKSCNHKLDSIAIAYLKTIRFIPAKRRGKSIPYFYYSKINFIECNSDERR
jgi:hypothetical protein